MKIPRGRVDFAFGVNPLTRPAETDWTTVTLLRSAHVEYGIRESTGEPEPSSMTVVVDDPDRNLDPSNTASPYYPNVKLRTRVRVVATPDDDDERFALTGFVNAITRSRSVGTHLVTIELDDLLAVQAGKALGTTAFDVELQRIYPVGSTDARYWPLSETSGRSAAEFYTGQGGAYLRQVTPETPSIPWDARPVQKFGWTGTGEIQRAELRYSDGVVGIAVEFEFALLLELALTSTSFSWPDTGGEASQVIWGIGAIDSRNLFGVTSGTTPSARLRAYWDSDGTRKLELVVVWAAGANSVSVEMPLDVFDDGQSHQVFVRLSPFATRTDSTIWVDGEARSTVDTSDDATIPPSTFDGRPHYVNGGAYFHDTATGETSSPDNALEFTVGRVAYFEFEVTDDIAVALWQARNRPWDGDRTGARIARLAALAGIDPLDLDLDDGDGICGPADINGRTLGELVDETAATEGGFLYPEPDGRIRLRARPRNDPTPLVVYGNSLAEGVVLCEPVEPELSVARTITVVEVEWIGSDEIQIIRGDTSTYGELTTRVRTVARTAGGARAVGHRLLTRNGEPREQIDSLVIIGALPRSTLASTFDIRPGDAVLLDLDEVLTLHIVETVAQDWSGGTNLTTTLGVREHVVLPVAQFDAPGAGFDNAVFGASSRFAAIPGSTSRTSPAARRRRRRSLTS
jgi:hypothetical protein